jgi:hypothetical protein
LRAHPKSIAKLKAKLNLLTGRSNGMGYERRKQVLHQALRGWVNYCLAPAVASKRLFGTASGAAGLGQLLQASGYEEVA